MRKEVGRGGGERGKKEGGRRKRKEEEVVTSRLLEKRGSFPTPLCSLGTSEQMMVATLT